MKYITKEVCLALTVFSKEITGISAGGSIVDVYQIAVAAYGLLFFFDSRRLSNLVAILAGIVMVSLGLFAVYDYPLSAQFVRQSGAVTFIYLGTAALLLKCSPDKLIIAYVNTCFFAAIFGIVQFCFSAVGVNILIKVPLRLDSFAFESSHYAVAVAPCVYFCLRYWDSPRVRRQGVLILTSVVLTVSATALVILALAFSLAFFKRRGIIAVLMVTVASQFLMMIPASVLPDVIASRFTELEAYMKSGADPWDTKHLTVLSLATNFDVMKETILDGRILGNGFCGHAAAYYRQFDQTVFAGHPRYGINALPAHCLVIRIISEFGIPGAILLGVTIWKFVSNQRADVWCMFFVMAIMARGVKLGSWIDYGLPVFLLAVFYLGSQMANFRARRTPPLLPPI